jgi:hypothetical protein
VAEGGFGGNSATPERIQKADSPAVLLIKSRTPHKSFLFLLEEKNRRAQIKKCEENFFAGWRGFRATAGLASLLGVLLKKCSNINQKTPPNCYYHNLTIISLIVFYFIFLLFNICIKQYKSVRMIARNDIVF